APLAKVPFRLPPPDSPRAVEGFRMLTHGDDPGATLLGMNRNRPFLLAGSQPLPRGVLVCNLAEAIRDHPDLVERALGQLADYEGHPFTALNTAFLGDGAFVHVPAGVAVDVPIYLIAGVSSYGDVPYVWYRRALMLLGKGSRATVVERFHGLPRLTYFTSAVT